MSDPLTNSNDGRFDRVLVWDPDTQGYEDLTSNKANVTDVYSKSASDALLLAKAPLANPTFTGTATFENVSGISKADVGLGQVDNTSDPAKPVSTATATALGLKAPLANPTFTGTATFENVSGISKADVGLGSVDNTSEDRKSVV